MKNSKEYRKPEEVEFKVRHRNNLNFKWEDIEISHAGEYISSDRIMEDALLISKVTGKEVRWNYKDSLQGHYVLATAIKERN